MQYLRAMFFPFKSKHGKNGEVKDGGLEVFLVDSERSKHKF